MFYWFLKWVALGPLLKLVFRPHAEGSSARCLWHRGGRANDRYCSTTSAVASQGVTLPAAPVTVKAAALHNRVAGYRNL